MKHRGAEFTCLSCTIERHINMLADNRTRHGVESEDME